eukprot:2731401-Lingulodinium_polyedra.AAC.1
MSSWPRIGSRLAVAPSRHPRPASGLLFPHPTRTRAAVSGGCAGFAVQQRRAYRGRFDRASQALARVL